MNTLKSKVELYLGCRNLPTMDLMSASDPFCVLTLLDARGNKTKLGSTEPIRNNNNPDFAKRFEVDYLFEEKQDLYVQVWDQDGGGQHDFIGTYTIALGEIVAAPGGACRHRLRGKNNQPIKRGEIIFKSESVAESKEFVEFSLCAEKLRKMDLFGKSDPYIKIYKKHTDGSWNQVHRTEHIVQNLNPIWKPFTIPLTKLCGGDKSRLLKMKLFDWDKDSVMDKEDDYMGEFDFTVAEVQGKILDGGAVYPLSKEKEKTKKKKKKGQRICYFSKI